MKSLLLTFSLVLVVLAYGLEGFSQDKNSGEGDAQKNSNKPPVEVKPKPPVVAPPLAFSSTIVQQSIVNGVRTLVATSNGEKVEINDVNGKNIVLKHTRMVGGKNETTEYQAEDLAALKAKSPEAAALYEKYGIRKEIQVPAQARARFQVPIQGRPVQPPTPFFADDLPTTVGPRKIRVELEDKKIEIFDSADESILLKVIKTVDGREQAEEFTADNLRQFKNLHPDAYLLYKKYTGLKVNE